VRVYRTGSYRKIGKYFHIRYTNALGLRVSESTGLTDETKTIRYLQKRMGEVAQGINPESKRNIGAMATAYLAHAEVAKSRVDKSLPAPTQEWRRRAQAKQLAEVKRNWDKHLSEYFKMMKRVTSAQLDDYVLARRKENAADATIQRELSLLQKILKHSEVQNMPKFPRLAESAPREGFAEKEDYQKLHDAIQDRGLRTLADVAYKYAFRSDEIKNLLVRQVSGNNVKLFKGTTKNSKPRLVVVDQATERDLAALCETKPIRDFRTAWANACEAAGVTLMFHDLRAFGHP
jgi:hypothetical protein